MTRTFPTLLAALVAAAIARPALAADPAATAGYWSLGPTRDDQSCDLELLPAIAYEFEGVWYVARPLHYEDNRAACRHLGVEDVVAWSQPEAGDALWLLAEGEAGFMEFVPGSDERWTIAKSGHADLPPLAISRRPDPAAQ